MTSAYINDLSCEFLREILLYDPETGVFTWKNRAASNAASGAIAGCHKADGYIIISINNRRYRANRLAYLYMTGSWPEAKIDHKNCIKDDNSWENIRNATDLQNSANHLGHLRRRKSAFKGVQRHARDKYWVAQIRIGGRGKHLGCFGTEEEAAAAYAEAAKKLFGEYARW